ncbi:hypothetical protein A4S06_07085 [Erysipelotrichaceae bacterium MTC7]|nr:hypothetical protein A4S06_07085 [Erysipelotrichaceae bacterium MTC7]
MKLFDRVNANYQSLNENDLYIWQVISKNQSACVNLSIEQLAKRCNVSRTTILRFAKKLGCKGYSELKVLLAMECNEVEEKHERQQRLFQVYDDYMEYLQTLNLTPIVQAIEKASNLYVFSTGNVQDSVAKELKRSFLNVNKLFFHIDSYGDVDSFFQLFHPDDLVVIVTYSGETRRVLEFARQLKINNIPMLSISVNKDNSLTHVAEYCLYVNVADVDNPCGARYGSLVNYYILIDYILMSYMQMKENEADLCD